jgi:hypothetical protein
MNMDAGCGICFLRTSLKDDSRILRESYSTVSETGYTMRVPKTDSDMRPVFHKKDGATMAHLHLALPAYRVVNTIRHRLKNRGLNRRWNGTARMMNTQKAVTAAAQNNCDRIIQIRRCSEPNEKVNGIYRALEYKPVPFKKKKSVVHKSKLKQIKITDLQIFRE